MRLQILDTSNQAPFNVSPHCLQIWSLQVLAQCRLAHLRQWHQRSLIVCLANAQVNLLQMVLGSVGLLWSIGFAPFHRRDHANQLVISCAPKVLF